MMNGSKILEGCIPQEDPTVVTRVLDAGTVIKPSTTSGEKVPLRDFLDFFKRILYNFWKILKRQ